MSYAKVSKYQTEKFAIMTFIETDLVENLSVYNLKKGLEINKEFDPFNIHRLGKYEHREQIAWILLNQERLLKRNWRGEKVRHLC